MEKNELMAELESLKSTLEVSISEKAKGEIAEQLKSVVETVDAKINEFKSSDNTDTAAMAQEIATLKSEQAKLLDGFDALQTRVKTSKSNTMENKLTFGQAFADGLKENHAAIENIKKGSPVKIEMKAVGNMTLGVNLLPDGNLSGYQSYSSRQAILPSQRINLRDLIPTSISPTGLYVQYRETGSEGSISVQTEGASKTQIDYDFTQIKIVENYIAGFTRFSKQMAKQLPYMQSTLPRLMSRDFYKAENALFYATVIAQADGNNTTTGTNEVEVIMDLIANQQASNFTASFAIVNPITLAAINKVLLTNGYYPGAAGVDSVASGAVSIMGTPVISASWAAAGTVLIIDADYLERVETESLNVEFSMDDADNFTKNLITARIECQEEINLMLPTSAIYYEF